MNPQEKTLDFTLHDAGRSIGRSLTHPAVTESSFDLESRELLWDRSRYACLIGIVISLVVALLHGLVLHTPVVVGVDHQEWVNIIRAFHVASFAVALGSLYVGRPGARRLQATAFVLIAVNLVLTVSSQALFYPLEPPFFAVSLLLFVHAAFIPCRKADQAALSAVALIAACGAPAAVFYLVPEAHPFWAGHGGPKAFWSGLLWSGAGTAILGFVSVIVTKTLYHLRKEVHLAQRLGNYLLEKEIGEGGMGKVYLARHSLLRRPTAVKVLRDSGARFQTLAARFEREVRISSNLTHPNTITIFDYGRASGNVFYYVMEFLHGMDVQKLVTKFGPVEPARAVYFLLQVCGSLAEAHDRHVIHRDVKPSNIFITHRGGMFDFVKVLDFGLAKQIEPDTAAALSKPGMLFGTPSYIAPEAVYGTDPIDGRTDIYNVGGVAYCMLTGHAPFESNSSIEIIIDHVKTIPRKPSEIAEFPVPAELDAIVMKCLEKKPQDRYRTVWELEAALRSIRFDEPWTHSMAKEWWMLHAPDVIVKPSSDDGSGDSSLESGTSDVGQAVGQVQR